jgi:16S rRNA (guanine(966)-N(2))-methyltransferase RsmD
MSKPRIIGGTAKNRVLETPTKGTRPSPARLREALFNILEFEPRGYFLDLFSGSGAVGLEAASRGWQSTCVDKSKEAVKVLRHNARNLKLSANIVQADALKYVQKLPQPVNVMFAAPPYDIDMGLVAVFDVLFEAQPAPYMIVQHPTDLTYVVPPLGQDVETREYGFNAITLVRQHEQTT